MADQNSKKVTVNDVQAFLNNFLSIEDTVPDDFFPQLSAEQREFIKIRDGLGDIYCSVQPKVDPNLSEPFREKREKFMLSSVDLLLAPRDTQCLLINLVHRSIVFQESHKLAPRVPKDNEVFSKNGYNEYGEYFVEKDEVTDWNMITLLWLRLCEEHTSLRLIRGRRRITHALTSLAHELQFCSAVRKIRMSKREEILGAQPIVETNQESETTAKTCERNKFFESEPNRWDVECGLEEETKKLTRSNSQPESESGREDCPTSNSTNIEEGDLISQQEEDSSQSKKFLWSCILLLFVVPLIFFAVYIFKYITDSC